MKLPSPKTCARLVARQPFLRNWIGQFALYYTDMGVNFSYDIDTNGEAWLLERAAKLNPRCVLDIGANVGDWTKRAAQLFKNASIFSFEPNPPVFRELQKNLGHLPRVTLKNAAIAEGTGQQTLNTRSGGNTGVSSLTKFEHHDGQVTVETVRGDEWIAANAIDVIDFMKIDVEGYELKVLASFEKTFAQHKVDLVQLEHASPNPYERIFLRDLYDFADAHGYLVGRIYANFVYFKPYAIRDEWWRGPNYVLCLRDKQETIDLLENKAERSFFMEYVSLT